MRPPTRERKKTAAVQDFVNSNSINKFLKNQAKQEVYDAKSANQKATIEAKRQRIAAREKLGIFKKSPKTDKGPMIPWIPFTKSSGKVVLSSPLVTRTHNNVRYAASWIAPDKKVPGVKVNRLNGPRNGIPHAVYTGGAFIINSRRGPLNRNLYVADPARPINYVTNSPPNRTLIRNSLQGPDVKTLNSIISISRNSSSVEDLYNYKLVGDRYTAEECQRLNKPNHYLIKPYSSSFAKFIEEYSWATDPIEMDRLVRMMRTEVTKKTLPFYFDKGVVYTLDRPLFLYCVKNVIPCIIETGGGFYVMNSDEIKSFETFLRTVYALNNSGVSVKQVKMNNGTSKKSIKPVHASIIMKCIKHPDNTFTSIFDTFHDFGKGGRAVGNFDRVKREVKTIYKNKEPYVSFIDMFDNQASIGLCEDVITAYLQRDPARIINKMQLTEMFKTGKFSDMCIVYDAGNNIPISVYSRVAATTQRISDGFYGAAAIRTLENYRRAENIKNNLFREYNLPNINFSNN